MPKTLKQLQWTIWWVGYWVKGLNNLKVDFPISGLASGHYGYTKMNESKEKIMVLENNVLDILYVKSFGIDMYVLMNCWSYI